MLRNKIADAIASIQELNKLDKAAAQQEQADCYIDVTRVSNVQVLPNSLHLILMGRNIYQQILTKLLGYFPSKVEKIAGKCHRASNGLPICQSENYMVITSDCS